MAEKKILAVLGATGAQGGGLVRAIRHDPGGGFAARAITRNPNSEKARALASMGVEVVSADADDPASLTKAFEGAHGAYCVTNFWEHMSPEREFAQAGNMAKSAKAARLRHVIWSTLEDTRRHVPLTDNRMPTLMKKYKVPHFDAKGEANRFFAESGVPTTLFLTSFYWDNLVHFGMGPKKGEDGRVYFHLPMGERKLPGIAAEDIGKCAYGIFREGNGRAGRTVGVSGEHLSGAEMAAALTRALGREVLYNPVPFDVYRGLGFPGAEDLGNMFQFNHDFEEVFRGSRAIEEARKLNPSLLTFADWIAANKERITIQ